jgi:hypothetical protein
MTSMQFAHAHGDIVSVMLIGGLPWPEAYGGKPYPKSVADTLAYRPPAGKKLFVSISPLNDLRTDMAPYWREHDNMPLPEGWSGLSLDDPKVMTAFLAFCEHVVETMRPDYLAIGVEDNVLLTHSPSKWRALKTLHKRTYAQLKKRWPNLPVFFTTDVGHYLEADPESKGKNQGGEVADLMAASDIFAMSLYPYLNLRFDETVRPGFLDFARKFNKPVAVSESGMTSRDVTIKTYGVTLKGSEPQQAEFEEWLLSTAARDHYAFVVNFATTDFDRLVQKLSGPAADLANVWAYTGMQTGAKAAKPALEVWDRFFREPRG